MRQKLIDQVTVLAIRRNLRLYVTQLRRKLEPDPARPRWLHTEPGMGYRYQPDPAPDAAVPPTAPPETGNVSAGG